MLETYIQELGATEILVRFPLGFGAGLLPWGLVLSRSWLHVYRLGTPKHACFPTRPPVVTKVGVLLVFQETSPDVSNEGLLAPAAVAARSYFWRRG